MNERQQRFLTDVGRKITALYNAMDGNSGAMFVLAYRRPPDGRNTRLLLTVETIQEDTTGDDKTVPVTLLDPSEASDADEDTAR